jgi:undecaprenyl-diphosphatase
MTDILKAWLQVPRPCVELRETVNLRVNMMTSFGTASAHSGNMMAIATLFVFGAGWRYGLVWVIVAILTGISRIYVGVHYPSQVVFGWSCGVVVATITWFSCQAILRRRNQDQVEPSHEERPEAG